MNLEKLLPADWEEGEGGKVRLIGVRCGQCGARYYPSVRCCHACGSGFLQPQQLAAEGRLYAYSTIYVGQPPFPRQYTVGYVDLMDGVRVFGRVQVQAGEVALRPGMWVKARAGILGEQDGKNLVGYVFYHAEDPAPSEGLSFAFDAAQPIVASNRLPVTGRRVEVVGIGYYPFRRASGLSAVAMGEEAAAAALKDAGVDGRRIDAVYVGNVYGGMLIGQRIVHGLGLSGIPTFNVENACASSSTAFHLAWQAISAGQIDTALVIGTENLSGLGNGTLPLNREDFEVAQGLIMPAVYAMRAQRFLLERGCEPSVLAAVSVKNRSAGSLNPNACFQSPVTLEEVLGSRMVATPLTLLMCCANADGAAAVVLCASEARAKRGVSGEPVYVRASVSVSGKFENGPYDMTTDEITERAARLAYEASGIGPDELDVVELHDAFSISELVYYEALGLIPRGEAVSFIESGAMKPGGKLAVNPSGGLLSRGHPIGATGVAQIVELVRQLRGTADAAQQEGARVALAHCTGGGIARTDHGACTVHILSS